MKLHCWHWHRQLPQKIDLKMFWKVWWWNEELLKLQSFRGQQSTELAVVTNNNTIQRLYFANIIKTKVVWDHNTITFTNIHSSGRVHTYNSFRTAAGTDPLEIKTVHWLLKDSDRRPNSNLFKARVGHRLNLNNFDSSFNSDSEWFLFESF